jgi:hypothetical protein
LLWELITSARLGRLLLTEATFLGDMVCLLFLNGYSHAFVILNLGLAEKLQERSLKI